MAAAAVTSAAPLLAMLDEEDDVLKVHALKQLDSVVPQFWYQISNHIPQVEALCEDEEFKHRESASLLASKVFYYLRELDEALDYALSAGSAFDINDKSEYVSTIIARALDTYFEKRQAGDSAPGGEAPEIDPRLEAVVNRMLDRCCADQQWQQALGICLEARRLTTLEEVAKRSDDVCASLRYVLAATKVVVSRHVREAALRLVVRMFEGVGDLGAGDWIHVCQTLVVLDDADKVAAVLSRLVESGDAKQFLLALQIAFDLFDNDVYAFMQRVEAKLLEIRGAAPSSESPNGAATGGASGEVAKKYDKVVSIISGTWPIRINLDFLHFHKATDLLLLKNMKDSFDARVSMTHSATVMANAFMHAGTTGDEFLRSNLEWLGSATNWAKFGATASLGVIHRGHLNDTVQLLAPYLPAEGRTVSPYSEGGALYALGIIHAGHGHSITEFLSTSLRNSTHEVVQHGACLGLGLSAQGVDDNATYDNLKDVLLTDSAVAGEAAAMAMGLLCCGAKEESAGERATEMLEYAHQTAHEKIIRGLAVGLAMASYGREENADGLIEQLSSDQDPILRFGGMFAIGMAYRGTDNNAAIQKLLHFAVSDVSDDVRRAAVMSLGFVLLGVPEQCPQIVRLLAESYNPHLRYGAAMAVGIACAGSGLRSARKLLEPMLKDSTDFVRQGACIAMAFVMLQQPEADVAELRKHLEATYGDKHEDNTCKMGAIMACGILDAGGRNVTVGLVSGGGYFRRTAVVAMAMFLQYWYWFPMAYLLPLAFKTTALIGVTEDLKLPRFEVTCACKKGTFAYAKPVTDNSKKKATKLPTAVLSTTKKAKDRAKRKAEAAKAAGGSGGAANGAAAAAGGSEAAAGVNGDAKADGAAGPSGAGQGENGAGGAEAGALDKSDDNKCPFTMENPCRVVPAQAEYVSFDTSCRFQPIKPDATAGILVLLDSSPDSPIEYVEKQSMRDDAAPAAGEGAANGGAAAGGDAAPAVAAAPQAEPDAPEDMDLEE